MELTKLRSCAWCEGDPLLRKYHNEEWCMRQLHDERGQFEFLTLEAMQCGLSWMTVLRKREAMRAAFDNFEPEIIAKYDDAKLEELMIAPGIIHSRGKLRAMITNARHFLEIAEEFGSFDKWFWSYTNGKSLLYKSHVRIMPAKNEISERMSADMKKRGFKYLGPVVLYSHMQAVGMINDHMDYCFGYGLLDCEIIDDEQA